MLRIHFLPEDLARTHVAPTPDLLWETVLSHQLLYNREGLLVFHGWRRLLRARVPQPAEAILLALSHPRGDIADLLTPAAGVLGLDAGLDAVRGTPRPRVRRDLENLATRTRLPAWAGRLAGGDRAGLEQVAGALRAWHGFAVAPFRDSIDQCLETDRAVRTRDAHLGGPERILAGLPAPLRWEPPVLHSPYPKERDVHLGGRGLLLVPSFFCWRLPITLIDPVLPPVLVYPVEHDPRWWDHDPNRAAEQGDRRLAALLGGTRAAVLDVIGRGPVTTSGIATRMGISAPSASEHAAILREAGLIITTRAGNSVLHSLSKAGAVLLDGPRRS